MHTSSSAGYAPATTRRSWLQRLQQLFSPAPQPRPWVSMRPNGAQPYVGELAIFGGNFAPMSWAFCDGSLQSIAQNTALFSLIGTTYGGDGQSTFALPDLRGRVPIHMGQGPGLSNYVIGQVAGMEQVTLLANQIPAHFHQPLASTAPGTTSSPVGTFPASNGAGGGLYAGSSNLTLTSQTMGQAGGSQPHNNMQPTLALNYIIALEGIYPSRA